MVGFTHSAHYRPGPVPPGTNGNGDGNGDGESPGAGGERGPETLWAGRFLGHPTTFGSKHIGPVKVGKDAQFFLWRVWIDRCAPLRGVRLPCRVNRPVGKDQAGEYSSGDGGEWIAELWTSPLGDDPSRPVLETKLGQTHVNGRPGRKIVAATLKESGWFLWEFEQPVVISRPGAYALQMKRASASSEYFAVNFVNGPFSHEFAPSRDGPYGRNVSGAWQRAGDSGDWRLDLTSDVQPFAAKLLFEGEDGLLFGVTDTSGGAPELMVGDAHQLRYRIRSPWACRAHGLWLCAHRGMPEASPLEIELLGETVRFDISGLVWASRSIFAARGTIRVGSGASCPWRSRARLPPTAG